MNRQGCERKRCALIWGTTPVFTWEDWENHEKILVRIACLKSKIWTSDLPNSKQKATHWIHQFGPEDRKVVCQATSGTLDWLTLRPWRWGQDVSPKRWNSTGLQASYPTGQYLFVGNAWNVVPTQTGRKIPTFRRNLYPPSSEYKSKRRREKTIQTRPCPALTLPTFETCFPLSTLFSYLVSSETLVTNYQTTLSHIAEDSNLHVNSIALSLYSWGVRFEPLARDINQSKHVTSNHSALPVTCFAYSATLKMEAVCSFETSVKHLPGDTATHPTVRHMQDKSIFQSVILQYKSQTNEPGRGRGKGRGLQRRNRR
jgi:hypothetical protein